MKLYISAEMLAVFLLREVELSRRIQCGKGAAQREGFYGILPRPPRTRRSFHARPRATLSLRFCSVPPRSALQFPATRSFPPSPLFSSSLFFRLFFFFISPTSHRIPARTHPLRASRPESSRDEPRHAAFRSQVRHERRAYFRESDRERFRSK